MTTIVISYRREDTGPIAGRLFDRLEDHFGKQSVFMDIDAIPVGTDFRKHIADVLDRCDVLLALIGKNWLDIRDGHGEERRLADETDLVRIEIETALAKKIVVIPVLIDRAPMPKPDQLPLALRDLAFRNAAMVDTGIDFRPHMVRLIRALDEHLADKSERGRTPRNGRSPQAETEPSTPPSDTAHGEAGGKAAGGILKLWERLKTALWNPSGVIASAGCALVLIWLALLSASGSESLSLNQTTIAFAGTILLLLGIGGYGRALPASGRTLKSRVTSARLGTKAILSGLVVAGCMLVTVDSLRYAGVGEVVTYNVMFPVYIVGCAVAGLGGVQLLTLGSIRLVRAIRKRR